MGYQDDLTKQKFIKDYNYNKNAINCTNGIFANYKQNVNILKDNLTVKKLLKIF